MAYNQHVYMYSDGLGVKTIGYHFVVFAAQAGDGGAKWIGLLTALLLLPCYESPCRSPVAVDEDDCTAQSS